MFFLKSLVKSTLVIALCASPAFGLARFSRPILQRISYAGAAHTKRVPTRFASTQTNFTQHNQNSYKKFNFKPFALYTVTAATLLAGHRVAHAQESEPKGYPLHHAISKINGPEISVLMKYLCTADTINQVNNAGCTPMHEAAFSGNIIALKELIRRGADINATTRRGSPLFEAVLMNNYETAKLLIQAKAELNIPDQILGLTPLGCALLEKNMLLAALLMHSGALCDPQNKADMETYEKLTSGNLEKLADEIEKLEKTKATQEG